MHLFFLLPQQFAGTCRDEGFAALLPRDVFAEVARAARRLLLRRARMNFLHRRRFSSALEHDSNLAEGFFVVLIAALRSFRSAIALSVAVFFIQRVKRKRNRAQQTATGIPPAPPQRQINAVRQTDGPRRFPQRSKDLIQNGYER